MRLRSIIYVFGAFGVVACPMKVGDLRPPPGIHNGKTADIGKQQSLKFIRLDMRNKAVLAAIDDLGHSVGEYSLDRLAALNWVLL